MTQAKINLIAKAIADARGFRAAKKSELAQRAIDGVAFSIAIDLRGFDPTFDGNAFLNIARYQGKTDNTLFTTLFAEDLHA